MPRKRDLGPRIRNEKGYGRLHSNRMTLRLTDSEIKSLEFIAKTKKTNRSEVIRQLIRKEYHRLQNNLLDY